MTEVVEVAVTAPDRALAERLAEVLVTERLAACAQVGGPVDSTYWWQSAIQTTAEWQVRFKTAPDRVDALVDQLRANHPYEVPEILVSREDSGNPGYTAWVHEQTRP